MRTHDPAQAGRGGCGQCSSASRQDGFNVWRQLCLEINSRTDCVRHHLRNKCQQVPQAPNNSHVWRAIADWETMYADYLDAGGAFMDYEDRRSQLLRILPMALRRDVLRERAREARRYDRYETSQRAWPMRLWGLMGGHTGLAPFARNSYRSLSFASPGSKGILVSNSQKQRS